MAEITSQKNCAQNKALQKCAADTFVYWLVERDETLSAAFSCALASSFMGSQLLLERMKELPRALRHAPLTNVQKCL